MQELLLFLFSVLVDLWMTAFITAFFHKPNYVRFFKEAAWLMPRQEGQLAFMVFLQTEHSN